LIYNAYNILIYLSGRPKYDRSKACVKCKLKAGNIVIRYAVYCKYVESISFIPCSNNQSQGMLLSAHFSSFPTGPGTSCQPHPTAASPKGSESFRESTRRFLRWIRFVCAPRSSAQDIPYPSRKTRRGSKPEWQLSMARDIRCNRRHIWSPDPCVCSSSPRPHLFILSRRHHLETPTSKESLRAIVLNLSVYLSNSRTHLISDGGKGLGFSSLIRAEVLTSSMKVLFAISSFA